MLVVVTFRSFSNSNSTMRPFLSSRRKARRASAVPLLKGGGENRLARRPMHCLLTLRAVLGLGGPLGRAPPVLVLGVPGDGLL